MNKIKSILKTEWFLVKLMFQTDCPRAIIYWILSITTYVIPLVNIWIWKCILDELTVIWQTQVNSGYVWYLLFVYLALQIIVSIIQNINEVIMGTVNRKADYTLNTSIMQKMSKIDPAFFDDPKNRDVLNAAQTSESYITANMYWAISIISRIISFISGMIMFLTYDILVGVLYMITYIPGAIISYRNKQKMDVFSIDNIPKNREKNYYKALLTGKLFAKDLRLYNLKDHFMEKYDSLWCEIREERKTIFKKNSISSFAASLLTYSGLVAIIFLSVYYVSIGTMALGTMALYVGLAQSTGDNFKNIVVDLACQVEIDVPHVLRYLKFLEYENKIEDKGIEVIEKCPEIEFCDVCFRYPGNDELTINHLSFRIAAGHKVALIGVNGAGKTTIVKLLLRFYEPESGTILIDGKDIKEYSLDALYSIFGVCFQDVQTYSLSMRENIAVSDIRNIDDDKQLEMAAVASGADVICRELPSGYDSEMTRAFDNEGVELSGGQWQKIALARAFFRKSKFLILDEPSSALDPEAEDYIFSSFKRLCSDKGGILISHRLSSVMMVDDIILLENGSVAEQGTHTELIQKNGKYAELYRMQAEKYVGGDKNE